MPLGRNGSLVVSESKVAILLAATRESVSLDKDSLRPLGDLAACLALSLEHLNQIDDLRRGISRAQAVARISQAVSTGREPADVCQAVQQYLAEEIGPSDFLVALYREERGLIEIPYFCKGSQVSSIEPYPLGEGLVSLLIRSGDPLLLEGQTGDYALMMDAAIQEQKAKSWLGVPLKAGANVIGALVIEDLASEGRFNRSDLELLEAIAPQVAFALSHTSLVSQNFKALEKNRRLHQVTHMAISGNSVDDAFAATVKGLQEVMGADHHVSVLLLNEDGTHLDVRAFAGYGALDLTRVSIPLEEGITGMAALQHRPICVADTRSDRRYIAADSRVCSELALPLLYRDQLLGVLNLENDRLDAYTSDDQEMLATLAGSLAAVVANAHLVGQIQRQVDRERLLFEITSKIRRSVDIPSILETSATELGKAVGARRAHIELGIPPGSAEVDHAPESDSGSNGHGSRPEVKA